MLLMIDNYDSFTYNLVQYFGELGEEVTVYRNDQISVDEVAALGATHIVVSPGPCTPDEAGISMDVIRQFGYSIPVLGVCLGHQSIAQVFGGRIIRAEELMHGKVSRICHSGRGIFNNLPTPFQATRYHSLVAERDTLPDCFEITAWVDDIVMGIQHRDLNIHGVQFHPESIMTEHGHQMLRNFLETA